MTEALGSVDLAPGLTAELSSSPDGRLEWRLDGDPASAGVDLVRLISARFDDGRGLALVATRPNGASGHGEETVTGLMLAGESGGVDTAEALLSTEYDSDGVVRRAGIELHPFHRELTLRIAADREGEPEVDGPRQTVRMGLRADGVTGRGSYELIDLR